MRHERAEDSDEGAHHVAAGVGFRRADLARRRPAKAGEQLGHGAAPTVRVLAEELGETLFAQAGGAVGGGIAREEGQRDRRVDVGKDGGGAGPEALEERAELIGEGDALGDEIVAAAHEGAQRAGVIGRRVQRPEAMAVRAKQVGEDEGIPRVTLGARRGVTRTTGLEGVGVDGHDLEAGVEQRVDEQPRGAFEGNAEGTTPAEAAQAGEKVREAIGGVRHRALPMDAAGLIEDADGMGRTRPVDPDRESHCIASGDGETLHGERFCRSLTDWRSGLPRHVARHPVAGLGLSSFCSGERVSWWPSRGERPWLSPNADRLAPLSSLDGSRPSDFRRRVVQ